MSAGRIRAIDALRGVAVALVMLRHAAPEAFPGGGVVGVVMFFSLSGYLITGVLLDELARPGPIRLRRFYLRRAVRLVPALLLMLVGFTLVTLLLDPLQDRALLPATWLVALTWTANLPFHPTTSDASFHLWTLAGEEQFYLLWPGLLVLGWKRGRLGRYVAIAGVVAVLAMLATTWWLRAVPDNAYALPTSWALCFVIGGAARLMAPRLPRIPVAVCAGAGVVLIGLTLLPVRGHVWTYPLVGALVAAATATLMLAARRDPRLGAWSTGLVALGTVSYAAYLWNYPLTLWLRPWQPFGPWVAAVLTVLCAALSWRLVERPLARFLRSRQRVETPGIREKVPRC